MRTGFGCDTPRGRGERVEKTGTFTFITDGIDNAGSGIVSV